jgi:hypothetical protein
MSTTILLRESVIANVIANREHLINHIEIDSILETFIQYKHMSEDLYRMLLVRWAINAYDTHDRYTLPLYEYIRRIKLEAAKSIIDGWIYALGSGGDEYNLDDHPIISAIISTGQSQLLKYIYPDDVARAA